MNAAICKPIGRFKVIRLICLREEGLPQSEPKTKERCGLILLLFELPQLLFLFHFRGERAICLNIDNSRTRFISRGAGFSPKLCLQYWKEFCDIFFSIFLSNHFGKWFRYLNTNIWNLAIKALHIISLILKKDRIYLENLLRDRSFS